MTLIDALRDLIRSAAIWRVYLSHQECPDWVIADMIEQERFDAAP